MSFQVTVKALYEVLIVVFITFYNIDTAILIGLQIVFMQRAILWAQNEQLSSDTISWRGKNITLLPENVLLMLLLTPYITIIESDRGQNNFSDVNFFLACMFWKHLLLSLLEQPFAIGRIHFVLQNEQWKYNYKSNNKYLMARLRDI